MRIRGSLAKGFVGALVFTLIPIVAFSAQKITPGSSCKVLNKKVFSYLNSNNCIWERQPLEKIVKAKQLLAYKFSGFWHAMDTVRDKNYLENLWASNNAPWKTWND